jgi:adenylate cyclase
MASIVPGYEYDIFISYRQKDNKHDGWVAEFVNNLKGELESTFKEEISVYFDINPHDGLLESHNVNASLKEKLKCLVFIPIISRTYCDPKSFAWQQEFIAFNKLAKEDLFGRDIKLTSGNVASRILPVKIHELELEDKEILEAELGGTLRAIEFIYKESGVNRPLKSTDNKNDNQNKTDYKNQVNKIANAIKEIIDSLKKPSSSIAQPLLKDSIDNSKNKSEVFDSIAVLPFTNMSSDPEQEFFSDGISEEIINMLAQVPALKVAGRTSSFTFKGKNQDLRIIGEQLNVNHILEGSVRKSGNKIRITAQLIKVADGYHLWSEKYDRELKDIFDIQDEISLAILNVIKIKLFGPAKEAVLKKYTANPEAYQLYLRGKFHWDKLGKNGLAMALELYKIAIEEDPVFSLAYVGLADTYSLIGFFQLTSIMPLHQAMLKAKEAALKALALDNSLAEAYISLGYILRTYDWNWIAAEEAYKKGIELNPNYATGHDYYALLLAGLGRFDEAMKESQKALDLEPLSIVITIDASRILRLSGKLKESMEIISRVLEIDPGSKLAYSQIGSLLELTGKKDSAVVAFIRSEEFYLPPNEIIEMKIYDEFWHAVLHQTVKDPVDHSAEAIARAYMRVGNCEKAIQFLQKSYKNHEGFLVYLNVEPLYKPLHGDIRFKDLVLSMGLLPNTN